MTVEQYTEAIKPVGTNTDQQMHKLTLTVIGNYAEIEWYEKRLRQVSGEPEVKPEICVYTDEFNGTGEYVYNKKLSEMFTLNNLIPQFETKVNLTDGEKFAQYEITGVCYAIDQKIIVNIYLYEY